MAAKTRGPIDPDAGLAHRQMVSSLRWGAGLFLREDSFQPWRCEIEEGAHFDLLDGRNLAATGVTSLLLDAVFK
jgi:hypothetical protein